MKHVGYTVLLFSFFLMACKKDVNTESNSENTELDTEIAMPADVLTEHISKYYILAEDHQRYTYTEPCGMNVYYELRTLTNDTDSFIFYHGTDAGYGDIYEVMKAEISPSDAIIIEATSETGENKKITLNPVASQIGVYQLNINGETQEVITPSSNLGSLETIPCRDREKIMDKLGKEWYYLSEKNGELFLYEECRYGFTSIVFDEKGDWLEFKGGGDAVGQDIVDMYYSDWKIHIKYSSMGEPNKLTIELDETKDHATFVFDHKTEQYTSSNDGSSYEIKKETPCDDD